MKKYIKRLLPLLFVLCFCILKPTSVYGYEGTYNEKIYHINDFCAVAPEDVVRAENNELFGNIQSAQFDFPIMIIGNTTQKDYDLTEYLDGIYKINDFGYGANHDGMILGMNPESDIMAIRTFGRAKEILSREDIDSLSMHVREAYKAGGYASAIHEYRVGAFEMVTSKGTVAEGTKEYSADFETLTVPTSSAERCTAPYYNGVLMPNWYEGHPDTFVDFHCDDSKPRVRDDADVLTPEEEEKLENRLREIRTATNQDIVVFTDSTSYGLDNETYEMDYYVYNGFGVGDDFDGLCLFINTDPENREMVTTAFGSMQVPFTQSNSNSLDDILFAYLPDGKYATGFFSWAEAVDTLLRYGMLDVPTWYKNYLDGNIDSDASSAKVVDDLHELSTSDIEKISARLQEISDTYNIDMVIYLSDTAKETPAFLDMNYPASLPTAAERNEKNRSRINAYLDLFYEANGYGFGQDKSGMLIGILMDEESLFLVNIQTYGSVGTDLTPKLKDRLEGNFLLNLSERKYLNNIDDGLDAVETYLRTGKVPHDAFTLFFWALLCLIVAFIFGTVGNAFMPKPDLSHRVRKILHADEYLVKNSFRIIYSRDILLHTTTKIVPFHSSSSSSSGSSSSGKSSTPRSSYSTNSRSSSGRSGTTSRRKF